MNGRIVLSCVLIVLLVIASFNIAEACKKCGQDACSCNSHHGLSTHHGGLAVHHGGHHGGHHGSHHGGLHGNLHGCGGVHIGGGCGLHVGGAYGVGGGLHVGHVGGGYGLGGGSYVIGGYGSAPPICNVCGGYTYVSTQYTHIMNEHDSKSN
jgi:hypothetical protein